MKYSYPSVWHLKCTKLKLRCSCKLRVSAVTLQPTSYKSENPPSQIGFNVLKARGIK